MKSYNKDEDRFGGVPIENLYRRVVLSNDLSEEAGVSEPDKPRVYSIMLKVLVLHQYFYALQGWDLKWN